MEKIFKAVEIFKLVKNINRNCKGCFFHENEEHNLIDCSKQCEEDFVFEKETQLIQIQ